MPKNTERQFQTWFKSQWPGYLTQVHPGLSADSGLPDLFIGYQGKLTPCELKTGTIKDNVLYPSTVRPSQVQWHRKLASFGFRSLFLVGVHDGKGWKAYAFDGKLCAEYKKGFRIGTEAELFEVG